MLKRKVLVLAKSEVTYGVDAVPTNVLNAIRCSNVVPRQVGDAVTREFDDPSLSPLASVLGAKYGEVKFTTEIKGSGVAGTAPEIGVLFKGCGFGETVVAVTSVTYDPVSSGESSLSIYVNKDGIQHKFLGCRGTFEVDLNVGKIGVINWTFQGLHVDPADSPITAGTYNAILPPVVLNAALAVGGYSAVASKLGLNMANKLALRSDLNSVTGYREITISDRSDRGGSFDPETVLEATSPFWGDWKNATQKALTVLVGLTAGNKLTVTGPKLQYTDLSYGDRDGVMTYDIPFRLARNAGDDEVKFQFT